MPRPENNRDLKIALRRPIRPPCEFKTDLDLERLPSGKFDTNDLTVAFAVLAYNILRWMTPILEPCCRIRRRRLRRGIGSRIQDLEPRLQVV
jgi:hypothetical protein